MSLTRARASNLPSQGVSGGACRVVARRCSRYCIALGLFLVGAGCVKKAKPDKDAQVEATSSVRRHTLVQSGYNRADRQLLLGLARQSLRQAVLGGTSQVSVPAGISTRLLAQRGCFVTLTIKDALRGCIGNILPDRPLAEGVISNARLAALNDSRFTPVTAGELSRIEIEVSVLGLPEPLHFNSPTELLRKLRPQFDGVVLKSGERHATFLPQVWSQLPDPDDFMNHLSEKAGLAAQAWREPGTEILIYQVEAFKESEMLPD